MTVLGRPALPFLSLRALVPQALRVPRVLRARLPAGAALSIRKVAPPIGAHLLPRCLHNPAAARLSVPHKHTALHPPPAHLHSSFSSLGRTRKHRRT